MDGIYLTEQGKRELKAKIDHLLGTTCDDFHTAEFLKQILSSATVLPVEKDWYHSIPDGTEEEWSSIEYELKKRYPDGVVIKK